MYNIIIYDENKNKVDIEVLEKEEQNLANKYILPFDSILELGARYGSVSCISNLKLDNKSNHVVVEPDTRVWDALEYNKINNNCDFNIVKGFLSNKKLDLINLNEYYGGYGSTSIEVENTNIPSYNLKEIKNNYNINKFNVLIADCEGFLETFFAENYDIINDLRLIIFEADYEDKCDYNKLRKMFKNNKFHELLHGHQNVWIKKTRI
jgi:FkbM family methyltransferase